MVTCIISELELKENSASLQSVIIMAKQMRMMEWSNRPTYAHFGSVVKAIEMKILLLLLIEAIFYAEDKVQDSQSKQHLRS